MKKINNLQKYIFNFLASIIPISLIAGSFISNLVLFLISLSLIYISYINNNWKWTKSIYFKLFLLLYIYLILNSFIAEDFEISLPRSIGYIKFLLLPFFIKIIFEDMLVDYKKVFFIWLSTLLFLSFDILYQGYFGENIVGYKVSNPLRNSSFFFDELKAAALIVGFAFISFDKKKFNSRKILLILSFFLIATLVTGERANFIRYLVIFIIFLIFYIKNIRKINYSIFLIIVLFFTITSNYFGDKILERYSRTISFDENEKNLTLYNYYLTSQYGAHALTSYYILKDNLLVGVGNKNFRNECVNYKNKILEKFKKNLFKDIGCSTHPHQIWYELLSEHGIIGTLLILIFFYFLIKTRFKSNNLEIQNIMALVYILNIFLPIIPFGSLFTSYNSTILWINISIFITDFKKLK